MESKELVKVISKSEGIDKQELLKLLIDSALSSKNEKKVVSPEEGIALLKKAKGIFEQEYVFKPGDIVRWKSNMKNRRLPEYGEPLIVLEMLEKPLYDLEKESGSPYFREPLNFLVGVCDEDGDFLVFHLDSRRFEPFELPQ